MHTEISSFGKITVGSLPYRIIATYVTGKIDKLLLAKYNKLDCVDPQCTHISLNWLLHGCYSKLHFNAYTVYFINKQKIRV
jgi:hypothetical protein